MQETFMKQAILLAQQAYQEDEVPVGCVIVKDGEIIASGYNTRQKDQLITKHAEIIAIEQANKQFNNFRLDDCDLYVTLEPCIMCAGAIYQARVRNVYFGAFDNEAGGFGGCCDVSRMSTLNHHVNVFGGICQQACQELLVEYFKNKR